MGGAVTKTLQNVFFEKLTFVLVLWATSKLKVVASLVAPVVKNACNTGDLSSIPGLGRSPGGETGKPLQYSCLENPLDRGAWRATVHGVCTELDKNERLTL